MGKWLGCNAPICRGANCPEMIFTGADWNTCWGEVYQIYRPLGPGSIRSGDFVGLYYVRTGHWFSLHQNIARTLPCPGSVNPATGEVIRCYKQWCNTEISLPSSQHFHLFITSTYICLCKKIWVRGTERNYGVSQKMNLWSGGKDSWFGSYFMAWSVVINSTLHSYLCDVHNVAVV